MKAISLWQPWAQCIVLGQKRIETRGWPTKVRGQVAIHAAKLEITTALKDVSSEKLRFLTELFQKCELQNLPRGAVVGTVEIIGCYPMEKLYDGVYDTQEERILGDWGAGRFGWVLNNPVLFETPVPAKGKQGFWNW